MSFLDTFIHRCRDNAAAVAAFVVTILFAAMPPILAGDWRQFVPVAVCAPIAFIVTFYHFPPIRRSIPKTTVFPGVRVLQQDEYWTRDEGDPLINQITDPDRRVRLVYGPSGAGKSTLLRTQVVPVLLARGWHVVHISEYTQLYLSLIEQLRPVLGLLPDRLQAAVPHLSRDDSAQPIVVILDQAEKLLSLAMAERQHALALLRKLYEHGTIRIVLVIREDFYLAVHKMLDGIVPNPNELTYVGGLTLKGADRQFVYGKLLQVVANEATVEAIIDDLGSDASWTTSNGSSDPQPVILPLALQMVGSMLEIEQQRGGVIDSALYKRRLLGTRGLVECPRFLYQGL